jgi:hypothetical protein
MTNEQQKITLRTILKEVLGACRGFSTTSPRQLYEYAKGEAKFFKKEAILAVKFNRSQTFYGYTSDDERGDPENYDRDGYAFPKGELWEKDQLAIYRLNEKYKSQNIHIDLDGAKGEITVHIIIK